jgi:hypothetical protein
MPWAKITGYVEVPDSDWDYVREMPTEDGYGEIGDALINDLDDLRVTKVTDLEARTVGLT